MNVFKGKNILLTGAGGSIGSQLAKRLVEEKARKVIFLDASENALFFLQQELRAINEHDVEEVYKLSDINDKDALKQILSPNKVDMIIHAAACKHVPIIEKNPNQGIRTNISGTMLLAQLAQEHEVEDFLMISTDKAADPISVMGSTKYLAEQYLTMLGDNPSSPTNFIIARFGNVMYSNGSALPLFEKQIAEGGPVTLTDRRAKRFFISVEEAVDFIENCLVLGQGKYVLTNMKQYKIVDLAMKMIAEKSPDPSQKIQIVEEGLRDGEKLEEVFHGIRETLSRSGKEGIERIVKSTNFTGFEEALLNLVKSINKKSDQALKEQLKQTVAKY